MAKKKAKKKMSAAARKKISRAAKAHWAKYRRDKKAGRLPTRRPGRRPGRRRGRRAAASSMNDLAGMTMEQLVAMRRQIDATLADRLVRGEA